MAAACGKTEQVERKMRGLRRSILSVRRQFCLLPKHCFPLFLAAHSFFYILEPNKECNMISATDTAVIRLHLCLCYYFSNQTAPWKVVKTLCMRLFFHSLIACFYDGQNVVNNEVLIDVRCSWLRSNREQAFV